MLARYFIERPVLANVIALLAIVIGAVALLCLPVAQYPPITPPTVEVTARYPGANAQTVVDTVALPIEQQVNGVEKMLYMQSTAANDGTYSLVVTFAVGTDLDQAQVQVQNRISAALAQLPDAVQSLGVVTKKKSTAILQIITLTSPDRSRDSLFLSNYATISLKDTIARIPGVGDAMVFGIGQYSMRVWLDPELMKARSLTPNDVIVAIQQQSQAVAAGQIGAPPAPSDQAFQFTVDLRGRFATVAQFEQIAVKTQSTPRRRGDPHPRRRPCRARRPDLQPVSRHGRAAGGWHCRVSTAGRHDVAKAVETEMKRRAVNFPSGIAYSLPFDTTRFVSASITEVYTTLIEASVLVLLVIVVFLQSWRATLVPATTVPVTIIGAFAAMAALGFSVNLLTLFALVLAIGIVVDDAIIVVEGSAKYIERGMEPKQAAALAMDELLRPILAITLVLLSVFLPASILPGIVGQLYRQFALVIAATAVISAINAVTLKPTQCALWLRPRTDRPNAFYRGFNFVYDRLERGYAALVQRLVRFPVLVSLVAVALSALAIGALTRLPTAFIPTEDQGYMLVGTQLPDGASLERTQRAMARVTEIARNIPGVEHVVTVGGASLFDNSASLANAGIAYVILKDWSRRGAGEDPLTIFKALQSGLDTMQDASAIVIPPPPIQGLGLAGGFQMQVQVTDGTFDYRKLQQVADRIVELGNAQPALTRLMTPFRASAPQLGAEIDRREAEALGVNVGDAFQAIQTYLGSTYVSQFSRFGHTFPVFVQADTRFRLTFEALGELNVRNSKGAMVPVGTLASVKPGVGPALIPLYNLNPSATINGVAAPGYSSGQALKLMDEIAASALPPGMSYGWTGVSYQEAALGNQSYWIFGLALLLVLMVLAGQYESWSAPLAVVIAVPLALLGTVAALMVAGVPNNIYTQIGLVLLIALSSKNAILIVEFARELRLREGQTIEQAAVEASRVRFRPILMTSIAFILGVLPLVFATGAGAAARRSIGITVFSGMLASTCIAVMFVPALFVVLQRWSGWRRPASVPKKGAT